MLRLSNQFQYGKLSRPVGSSVFLYRGSSNPEFGDYRNALGDQADMTGLTIFDIPGQ
jgi:hypothetical protein